MWLGLSRVRIGRLTRLAICQARSNLDSSDKIIRLQFSLIVHPILSFAHNKRAFICSWSSWVFVAAMWQPKPASINRFRIVLSDTSSPLATPSWISFAVANGLFRHTRLICLSVVLVYVFFVHMRFVAIPPCFHYFLLSNKIFQRLIKESSVDLKFVGSSILRGILMRRFDLD